MWFYSGKSGCIPVKFSIRARLFNRAKLFVFGQMWLYPVKWLYLGKSGSIWAKLVVFCQSGCVRAKVSVVIEMGVRGESFRTLKLSSLPDINLG